MSLHLLLHPPARLTLHERRSWRMLAIGNALGLLASGLWVMLFAGAGAPHEALVHAGFGAACATSAVLLARGRRHLAGRVTMVSALGFLVYNAVWLNPPVPGLPPSAHQYLLALALASLLILRDDHALMRYGLPLAALGAWVALAGSGFTLATAHPIDPGARVWGAWSDHGVSAVVVLLVLHVLQTDVVRRDAAEIELRDAILRDELELHYQPQVDDTGRVLGAEALVRWRHPQRGLVPPAEFVPLAEASGLIRPLGEWVLRRACEQLAAWQLQPVLGELVVAVNVSAQQFEQADFVPQVLGLLAQHRVPPGRLKIELTESALASDLGGVIARMHALRRHGVHIALDDFGTGFSSLSVLRRLPLDQVKIDQSFVRGLLDAQQDEAIVRTIVELGRSLGLEVIAEGVETPAHREVLARLGCGRYQGYLYGRPVPAAALEEALRRLPRQPAAALAPEPCTVA